MPTFWLAVPAEKADAAIAALKAMQPSVVLGVLGDTEPMIRIRSCAQFERLTLINFDTDGGKGVALFSTPIDSLRSEGIACNLIEYSVTQSTIRTRSGVRYDHTGVAMAYKHSGIDLTYANVVSDQLGLVSREDRQAALVKIETICMWDDWYNQTAYGRVYKTMKMIGAM